MLNGKDILILALEDAIANFDVANDQKRVLTFDNTEYKAFLTSFNSSKDIVNLSEQMIDKLAANIDVNENKQSFIATIKFLKGLAELSQKEDGSISLNSNQLAVIEELKRLIVETIQKNESLISVLGETSEETNQKYIEALNLLKSNNLLSENDYDLIEEVVMKLYVKDNGHILDEVMTYLNKRNAEKLEKVYQADIAATLANDIIKQEKIAKRLQEEMLSKMNVRLISYIQKSKLTSKNYKGIVGIERIQKTKEILAYLGFNYDLLPSNLKNILSTVVDLEALDEFAHYLKDKNPILLETLNKDNINGLVFLLTNSNQEIVDKILSDLTYNHNVSDQVLSVCINSVTTIFGVKHYENFLTNSSLIKSVQANIDKVVYLSPLFLVTNSNKINSVLKILTEKGANIKYVLENCVHTLSGKPHLIERNLKILEMYGFDLDCVFKEESGYILLNNADLATKLDYLIEANLNSYIHDNEETASTTLRTLIVKRVYYASKHNLPIWGSVDNVPAEYHKLISESDLVIDDSDISLLFAEYPILAEVDNKYCLQDYHNAAIALLKRKTELIINQKIISRLKIYLIFKILVENNISPKEAIYQALMYRSTLEANEMSSINEVVGKEGVI